MSCRESDGGKAVCAAATASGIPSAHVDTLLHACLTDARNGTAIENPTGVAPADEVHRFYDTLERDIRAHPSLSNSRRERILAKIAAARTALDLGERPDNAMMYAWQRLPRAWDTWQQMQDAGVPSDLLTSTATGTDTIRPAGRRRSGSTRPYHKRFANFNAEALAATDDLFASRPSRMSQQERETAFRAWVDRVSDAYGMERPDVRWDTDADFGGGGYYQPSTHSITMSPNHPSVTTLIHEFRHALQHAGKGAAMVDPDVEIDARAWSLSLYYKARPALFERLVREGRIFHITVTDLDR